MCPPSRYDAVVNRTTNASTPSQYTPGDVSFSMPRDSVSLAAYSYAKQNLHPDIFAHSIRVFLLAKHLAEQEADSWLKSELHHTLLFTACIFHDIGTCQRHNTSPMTRFEIEGADAAREFLADYPEFSVAEQQEVWNAIALHSTQQVAERIPGLVRLVRLAVMADFKRPAAMALVDSNVVTNAEEDFPRGSIEKVLGDVVVDQAMDCERPESKAPPASWPGDLLRAKLADPDHDGVNKGF